MQANGTLQAVLFSCLLIAAGGWDLKKRMIPDSICILIFLTGLINFSPVNLLGALLSLPFFLAAWIDEKHMGGGDVKFIAAVCSVLGVNASIWAFSLALPLPIGICIWKIAMNHLHRKKKPWNLHMEMPLLPILAVGFLPAYILKFGGFI
jgi:leader peptidase (prepilin peptidase)/N-methyltransferase